MVGRIHNLDSDQKNPILFEIFWININNKISYFMTNKSMVPHCWLEYRMLISNPFTKFIFIKLYQFLPKSTVKLSALPRNNPIRYTCFKVEFKLEYIQTFFRKLIIGKSLFLLASTPNLPRTNKTIQNLSRQLNISWIQKISSNSTYTRKLQICCSFPLPNFN